MITFCLNSIHKLGYVFMLFFLSISANSQTFGTIKGMVSDKNNPLEYVNVILTKTVDTTKVIKFVTTDIAGKFLIDKIELGNYAVKFQLIGYKSYSQKVAITNENLNLVVNNITLNSELVLLNEVSIKTQKKLIEKTPQGFIVNASANITQAGGTATDLLKNTPTVSVDAEGSITLRGKSPLILVNGRNSNLGNPDQIPASSVESIEIINNATAKYDANAEGGIINIKLKKNKQNGTNGAFALGAGFGAKGRINSSVIVNHKTKKWNFGLGYDNRFAGRTREINASRTNYFIVDEHQLNQNRNDNRLEQLQNLKLNIDYAINEKNQIMFEAIGNTEGQDNHETLNSVLYKQNDIFNSNTNRHSDEIARSKVAEFALDYIRKYDDEKKSLTANISTSINRDRENTDITSQSLTEDYMPIGDPFLERTHNYENGNISNAKIDYACPIFKKGILETGYKGVFRSVKADFEASNYIDGSYVIDPNSSNIFNFHENVQAFYALYNATIGTAEIAKWKYNMGIRAEQTFNNGITENNSTNFKNNYLNLFPTTSITYNKSTDEYIKLSYGKRINRPSLGQLNPFTDITDALNPHSGNPYLKPEIIHAIELGYNKEWSKISLSSNLFYRYALNTIRPFYQLQPDGVNLIMPMNIGNATAYGVENILNVKPSSKYDFNASISLFQQNLDGSNISPDAVQNAFGWNGKLINNFTPWKNSKLQIIGSYNSEIATPQGKRLEQYFVDFGFQQKLIKGNARLGLTVVDIFNTLKSGYINNTSDFSNNRTSKADTRAIMLTFAYTFKSAFKEELLENQFSKEY